MTINEAYVFIQNIYNKTQQGNIAPEQINSFFPVAQEWVLNQLLGEDKRYSTQNRVPIPTYGLGLDQQTQEHLRPIIKTPTALVFTAGVATYPTDSVYLFDLAETSSGKEIYPCEVDEGRILSQSVIKPPIIGSGKYYVLGANMYVLPLAIVNALVTYIRKPLPPLWNYTFVNTIPTYAVSGGIIGSGNSQDFELGSLVHLRICARVLQMAGINLSLYDVVQAAQAMEAQGA